MNEQKQNFATEIFMELKTQIVKWRFAFFVMILIELLTVIAFYVMMK